MVTPASLRLAWAEEFEKWLPHLRPAHVHVIESHADRLTADALPVVSITSYEMMARLTCDGCKKGEGATRCEGPARCMAAMGFQVH